METEISAARWAMWLRKDLPLLYFTSVIWLNFPDSFTFINENWRLVVIVFVSMTKIKLFLLMKF